LIESTHSLLSTSYEETFEIRDLSAIAPASKLIDAGESEINAESKELAPGVSERIHSFWSWDMALSPDQRLVASVSGQGWVT